MARAFALAAAALWHLPATAQHAAGTPPPEPVLAGPAVAAAQPVPPRPETVGELEPFRISYARLGTQEGWECNKLFLEEGSLQAEVFLNIRSDGKQSRFVEKDEEYRLTARGGTEL